MAHSSSKRKIFIVVLRGKNRIDLALFKPYDLEVINVEDLSADPRSAEKLSREARAFARKWGWL